MKKVIGAIFVVIVIAIASFIFVAPTNGPQTQEETLLDTQSVGVDISSEQETQTQITSEGKYIEYNDELLSNLEGKTVLFFHAKWCPSCNAADKKLSVEQIPEGITIYKMDYDKDLDLRRKYGVVAQHTFVQVDSNGEKVTSWFGGRDVEDILSQIK